MSASAGLDSAIRAVAAIAAEHADDVDRLGRVPEETVQALRSERLMGLLVPSGFGGPGGTLAEVATVCHALAQACGASGMIYAMHQIQVACVVAHGSTSPWHQALLRQICSAQLLLGSATSEAGTGGNILTSLCAVETVDGQAALAKDASTISYGAHADALLVTARRNATAAANDQVMLVALRADYTLERTSGWDALGMRGTCSDGFKFRFSGGAEQVLPAPFGEIAGHTMLPVSHMLWASVWLGIAGDAVSRARAWLRQQVRGRGNVSVMTQRLARAVCLLQLMQGRLSQALREYQPVFNAEPRPVPLGYTADMNNLKTGVSELCLEAVQHAFMICGINAYRNNSPFSLGRHVRDLMSAPVMINNDRMLENTGNLLLMQKPLLGTF